MRAWIDTHLHLLLPEVLHYGWTHDFPALQGRFDWARYAPLAAAVGIRGALHMEVDVQESEMEKESDLIHSLPTTDEGPRLLGLIAACRPEATGFSEFLARQHVTRPWVRGFRRVLHTQPDRLSATELFERNLRSLANFDYSFDLCVAPHQLRQAHWLATQAPDTQFILDHCGVPEVGQQEFEPWRSDLANLARASNVACKISGLIAYGRPERWNSIADIAADLRPYVEHVIDCFGWDRVLWGSDWPVCNLTRGLGDWMQVTEILLEGCSDDEVDRLASRNASRIYRIEAP